MLTFGAFHELTVFSIAMFKIRIYLDFEDLHALVFPLPDRNTLFIALERMEQDIPRMTRYISRLLQQNEMTYDYE
jgi:hypothetical protein